jgi:hypothetical protein
MMLALSNACPQAKHLVVSSLTVANRISFVEPRSLQGETGWRRRCHGHQVHRVLDLVGIPDFVPTYDTRLEATGAFAS